MRSLSKIIKAADLKVILNDAANEIIRSHTLQQSCEEDVNGRQGPLAKAAASLEQAAVRAEEIVAAAQQEAASLHKQAEDDLSAQRLQAKRDGWNEGFTEGLEQGRQEAMEQAQTLIQTLETTVQAAVQARSEALKQQEADFLKLALLLAEKIIRRQITENPSWLRPIVDEALERLSTAEHIVIRIHPKDYQPLQEAELSWTDYRGTLTWEPDETLKQGTLIFETEFGALDASLEQRLGKLAENLLEVTYHGDE